jgi:DNA polymerase III alpha subunit
MLAHCLYLKELLEETYGVIAYQEQVMQISNRVAGYSSGDADLLRRAMGKKKLEMVVHRERFVAGAMEPVRVDFDSVIAIRVWLGRNGHQDRAQALAELFQRKPGDTQVRLRLER